MRIELDPMYVNDIIMNSLKRSTRALINFFHLIKWQGMMYLPQYDYSKQLYE